MYFHFCQIYVYVLLLDKMFHRTSQYPHKITHNKHMSDQKQ
jgi:hypothetical protein